MHGLDTAPSEGIMLPPVMEDLGKGDLVRKNVILSISLYYGFSTYMYTSLAGLLVLTS